MSIKDRVICDLKSCAYKVPDSCIDCSKRREGLVPLECMEELMKDALELLKGRESKPVLHRDDGEYCPWCSTISTRTMGVQRLHRGTRYCPYCGQEVKWE